LHYPGSNTPQDDAWQTGTGLPEELACIVKAEFERSVALLAPLPLQIISPSRWLAAQSQQSHIGQKWQTQVIPYGIDITIFRPGDVTPERKRWKVPEGSICLLFGCASLTEERKGFGALKQALALAMNDSAFAQAAANGSVQLLLFGAESPPLSDLPVQAQHLGVIRSESDMASVYQAADAYLCPTLEDNLPNTVLESLACGTPVVGFATGGLPDMVTHDANGLLAPCGDIRALGDHLIRIVTDESCRQRLQQQVRHTDLTGFALQTQAQRVQDFYQELLAKGAPPVPSVACSPAEQLPPWLMKAAVEALQLADKREAILKEKLTKAKVKSAKPEAKPPVKRRWWQ
jgi:glycosyltransferase involved in cell wall biosynthesis